MLRQVFIYYQSQRIYFAHFGKALDEESFTSIFKKLQQEAFTKGRDPGIVGSYDFYKYRFSFIASPEKEIIFVFVTDLTDSVDNIKAQLQVCRHEFLELFESVLGTQFDKETFEVFSPTVERIHKELRPKISLVGFSGVGKTTITKLIRAEEIPMEHVPTITGEIGTIQIGKLSFALWDFAGQEQFSFLWNKFVKGSDAILLITDSTLENVDKSQFFVELVKQQAPYAHMAIIGNKQDLPGAMPSPEIERMLGGIHTYSMVATDPANRDKMITIIADILEMSAEISPLLKPLLDRDKKMAMAEETLMGGDFQGAYRLFNEIADLCLELGDDSLSSEFHQKANKVRGYLSQVGQDVQGKVCEEPEPAPSHAPLIATAMPPPVTSLPPEDLGTEEMAGPPAPKPVGQLKVPSLKTPMFKPAPPKLLAVKPPVAPVMQNVIESPVFAPPAGDAPMAPQLKPPTFAQHSPPPPPPITMDSEDMGAVDSAAMKRQINATLMDLKIKVANMNKFLLEIEMKNLTGEMSDADFNQKKQRAEQMKVQLEQQLAENQDLLKDMG